MYTNYEIVPFHWLNIITYEFKWQNITITMYLFKYLKFKSFKFFFQFIEYITVFQISVSIVGTVYYIVNVFTIKKLFYICAYIVYL